MKVIRNVAIVTLLFCVCLTFTGCAKNCAVEDCEADAIDGYDYCGEHKCETENCNELKKQGHKYCEAHLCSAMKCENEVTTDGEYCTNHECSADNCKKQKVGEEKYCKSHVCKREKCHNYTEENEDYCAECVSLVCTSDLCNKDKIKGYAYCKEHKCKKKTCNKKNTKKGYCEKHYDAALKSALAKLTKSYDSVEDTTWYTPACKPTYINSSSTFYTYLGKSGSQYWLRWEAVYLGSEWVFFDEIIINVDGHQYRKTFSYTDIERDNRYPHVWEYFDVEPSDGEIEMLEEISKSKSAVIRYKGDGKQEDRTITAAQKKGIRDVLRVWKLVD
ncbi:hypothetical protein AALA22_07430 [Anaerovoracaceae bacterium 41-7]